MAKELKGSLDGKGLHVAIIAAQFNEHITSRLLQGARDGLVHCGVHEQDTTVVWVPGSLELPQAAATMASTRQWDAIVTLGCVIKGETAHFEYVASAAAHGVAQVARDSGIPIAFGVLTTYDTDQAMARSGGKLGNRGYDAAKTAVKMATLMKELARD